MFYLLSKNFSPKIKASNSRLSAGYTLLELIVVIVIIAIVFSVGTVSYRGYQKRQYYQSVLRNVVADLKLAQEFALAGKTENCTPPFQGYVISEASNNPANKTYSINLKCNGSVVSPPYKTVDLPDGFAVDVRGNTSGDGDFAYEPLGRGLDVTGSRACVTVTRDTDVTVLRIDKTTGNMTKSTTCP